MADPDPIDGSRQALRNTHATEQGPGRARNFLALAAVLTVCAGVRIWLIRHTEVIARDGTVYTRMARQWSADPRGVVDRYDYHVGYPVAIVAAHRVLDAMGAPAGAAGWELAGQGVSLIASLAATVAVWMFAATSFNGRVAWIAALLFGVGRKWAVLGADVLSDGLAVCLQMWAAVLAVAVAGLLRRQRKRAVALAAGVGLCAGAGYLVRPEALLVVGLAVVLWLGYLLCRRVPWRLTLASVAAALLAATACAAPYMMAIGGLTKKKSLGDIVAAPQAAGPILASVPPAKYSAIRQFVIQIFEALHPAVAILLCFWLGAWIAARAFRAKALERIVPPLRRVSGVFMLAATALTLPMLMSLYWHVHYMSHRHLTFLAAVLSALAGAGLLVVTEGFARLLRSWKLWPWVIRLVLPATTAALVVGMLFHTLRPLHEGKGGYRQAGRFAAAQAGPQDHILADHAWTVYYAKAERPGVMAAVIPPDDLNREQLLRHIERTSASHLVLCDRTLACAGPELASLLKGPAFTDVGRFPDPPKKGSWTLHVYRIDLAALRGQR